MLNSTIGSDRRRDRCPRRCGDGYHLSFARRDDDSHARVDLDRSSVYQAGCRRRPRRRGPTCAIVSSLTPSFLRSTRSPSAATGTRPGARTPHPHPKFGDSRLVCVLSLLHLLKGSSSPTRGHSIIDRPHAPAGTRTGVIYRSSCSVHQWLSSWWSSPPHSCTGDVDAGRSPAGRSAHVRIGVLFGRLCPRRSTGSTRSEVAKDAISITFGTLLAVGLLRQRPA